MLLARGGVWFLCFLPGFTISCSVSKAGFKLCISPDKAVCASHAGKRSHPYPVGLSWQSSCRCSTAARRCLWAYLCCYPGWPSNGVAPLPLEGPACKGVLAGLAGLL